MNKMQIAHEMALAIQGTKLLHDMELVSAMAWKYADAMQAEAEKRECKERPGVLIEEWQPDWSQAPNGADAWRMYGDGKCAWLIDIGGDLKWMQSSPSFDYSDVWQDSLRKRPQ